MNIGCWNVRDANDILKYSDFKKFVFTNKLFCFGLVETKLSADKVVSLCSRLWPGWQFVHNLFNERARIIVVWNPVVADFKITSCLPRIIHGDLRFNGSGVVVSFVYGFNVDKQRDDM